MAVDDLDEAQLIENGTKLAEKLAKRYHAKSFKEQMNKIRTSMMQKGYPQEMIQTILDTLDFEKDEEAEADVIMEQGRKLWNRNSRLDHRKRVQKVKQSLYQKGFDGSLISELMDAIENGETDFDD